MITINTKPQLFTPSDNPIIWQVTTTDADVVYFDVRLTQVNTNVDINHLNIYPTPILPTSAYCNLSKLLKNTVGWEVNNTQSLLIFPITKTIQGYNISFVEYVVSGNDIVSGATLTPTQVSYLWNGKMDRFSFYDYSYNDYVISNTLPAKFLTHKPDNGIVNQYSSEQLYFIQEDQEVLNIVIRLKDKSGVITTYTQSIDDLSITNKMYRIQAGPKALIESLLISFDNIDSYSIRVEDADGNPRTETRNYRYREVGCNANPQNIWWVNSLGGIDIYQFLNPSSENMITRNSIKVSPYSISADGLYSDRDGDILNPTEKIIQVDQVGNYTVYSSTISDKEGEWLNELFISEQVFVELNDGSLITVQVTDNQYKVQQQRLNRQAFNYVTLHYSLSGGLIPTSASAYTNTTSNGEIQLKWLNNQINTPI